jgi:hypothetical protein
MIVTTWPRLPVATAKKTHRRAKTADNLRQKYGEKSRRKIQKKYGGKNTADHWQNGAHTLQILPQTLERFRITPDHSLRRSTAVQTSHQIAVELSNDLVPLAKPAKHPRPGLEEGSLAQAQQDPHDDARRRLHKHARQRHHNQDDEMPLPAQPSSDAGTSRKGKRAER